MNCQGLGDFKKRRDVFQYLRQKKYSIYCLQDSHFNPKLEKYVEAVWGYKCLFSSFKSNSRGVAVLLANNFDFKINHVTHDKNGNFLIVQFTTMEKQILLINVYGLDKDSPWFYESIRD